MVLARYERRFGGAGTIVTLADGSAFTAAHCVAAVDGRRGTVLAGVDGRQWRVVRRWSPRGHDVAWLEAVGPVRMRPRGPAGAVSLAPPDVLRPGVGIVFSAYTGRRFTRRRAVVVAVSATRAVAEVRTPAGVGDGDSGGPVLVEGHLAGIVVARLGAPRPAGASSHVVVTRLDLHAFCTKSTRLAF